jgi:hypothetical protein
VNSEKPAVFIVAAVAACCSQKVIVTVAWGCCDRSTRANYLKSTIDMLAFFVLDRMILPRASHHARQHFDQVLPTFCASCVFSLTKSDLHRHFLALHSSACYRYICSGFISFNLKERKKVKKLLLKNKLALIQDEVSFGLVVPDSSNKLELSWL